MNKTRKKSNHLVLALVVAAGLLLPVGASAQGGVFGRGDTGGGNRSEVEATGMLNQGFGSSQGGLYNQVYGGASGGLYNQVYGGTSGGLTNQGFGAPLGSGVLFMLAAGAGYATIKTRKRNKKNK